MGATGLALPNAAVSKVGGGSDWVSPGNIFFNDALVTTNTPGVAESSDLLVTTQYGFAVPAGKTITGIKVVVDIFDLDTSDSQLATILTKDGTNFVGSAEVTSGSAGIKTYGGDGSMWGTTWTVAQVNASTFGVMFQHTSNSAVAFMHLDYVEAQIFWLEVDAPQTLVSQSSGLRW